jgi:hypothetical protein
MPDLKISVVTASFNAAAYIGDALASVLSQNYPGLEYLVLDGASKDNTFDIVERHADKLAYHASEPDNGQYHAIQAGMEKSTGDIMAWLNADDVYMPWTLSVVSEIFDLYPEVEWLTGLPSFLNGKGQLSSMHASAAAYPQHYIRNGWYRGHLAGYLQQESMFWRRSLWEKAGGLDLDLSLAADFKLWTGFARHARLWQVVTPLAAFRKLPGEQRSSTQAGRYEAEVSRVCESLQPAPALWDRIASKGLVARSLCRLVQYKPANLIVYSETTRGWEMLTTRRSISRVGLGQLMLEHQMKKHR